MPRITGIGEMKSVGIKEQCVRHECPGCHQTDTYGPVPIGGICVCVCGRHFRPYLDSMGLRGEEEDLRPPRRDLTKKEMRTIHIEAMKSCKCISSEPARNRCTVRGWIRCTGTAEASARLTAAAEQA